MANLDKFKPTLHNEISIEDESVYKEHKNLIKEKKYSEATALLSNNKHIAGGTASLLNSWEEKLQDLDALVTDEFYDPYEYSETEPSVSDNKLKGFKVFMSRSYSEGTQSVARFVLFDNTFGRHLSASYLNDESSRPAAISGEFGHLKCVIDRINKTFKYYWNGSLIESYINPIHETTPNLGAIVFQLPYEDGDVECTSKLYVDNVKVYITNYNNSYVTTIIDETFDNYTLGSSLSNISGTNWWGGIAEPAYSVHSKIVKKIIVDSDASDSDRCVEFTPLTSHVRPLNINFRMDLYSSKVINLGSGISGDRYAVFEMDLAIKGSEEKPKIIWQQEYE